MDIQHKVDALTSHTGSDITSEAALTSVVEFAALIESPKDLQTWVWHNTNYDEENGEGGVSLEVEWTDVTGEHNVSVDFNTEGRIESVSASFPKPNLGQLVSILTMVGLEVNPE